VIKIPTKDMIQEFGKKLKHPQIRVWIHPKKGGDDYYRVANFSKNNLLAALLAKPFEKKGDIHEKPLVAYNGYEYTVKEFIKKYPKYKLKGKIQGFQASDVYKQYLK